MDKKAKIAEMANVALAMCSQDIKRAIAISVNVAINTVLEDVAKHVRTLINDVAEVIDDSETLQPK